MNDHSNIARIKAVYISLEDLGNEVVFVGGATVSLYKDKPALEVRVTDDVDVVIEIMKYKEYAEIEERLRQKGFENDKESGVICRYKINGIIVDIMPTTEILGFKNQWYAEGFKNAIEFSLSENIKVKIFDAVYFIASKFDAFNSRGNNDGRTSSDFEDIVYILNNRSTVWDELSNADQKVKTYIREEFRKLINQDYLYEWISTNLEYSEQKRVSFIIGGINAFIENE